MELVIGGSKLPDDVRVAMTVSAGVLAVREDDSPADVSCPYHWIVGSNHTQVMDVCVR
jgi:hypothetical protein